jgi:hypothetical protein
MGNGHLDSILGSYSIPGYLAVGSYSIPGIDFVPITRPKIPALRRVSVSNFKIFKKFHGSK